MFIDNRELKALYRLALPVIVGQLGHKMMGIVDSLMVGRLGATSLAAAGLANSIFALAMLVGYGFSLALTPLIARANSEGNKSEGSRILRQGLILNLFFGFIMLIISYSSSFLIMYLNQPPQIVDMSVSYLKILSISLIPIMFFQTFKQFAEGLSIVKPAMGITLFANIFNILANWVFIFGNLGVPAMGLKGAGIATFISRTFMAVAMLLYFLYAKKLTPYCINFSLKNLDWKLFQKILRIGLPASIQYFFEVSVFSLAAVMIGWLGTKELAAHQIAISLASFTYMFVWGISAAAAVRVASALGKKDLLLVRKAGLAAFLLGNLVMAGFALIFIFGRKLLPSLYISDAEVIQIASSLLIIAAFFQISDATQTVGLGALRGLSDMKIPTLITFIAYWMVGLPTGYFLAFNLNFGVNGIWLGLMAALSASAILLARRFHIQSQNEHIFHN
ncbi:MATE family efflux transporter [Candidatus Riflebacteria bacterium]